MAQPFAAAATTTRPRPAGATIGQDVAELKRTACAGTRPRRSDRPGQWVERLGARRVSPAAAHLASTCRLQLHRGRESRQPGSGGWCSSARLLTRSALHRGCTSCDVGGGLIAGHPSHHTVCGHPDKCNAARGPTFRSLAREADRLFPATGCSRSVHRNRGRCRNRRRRGAHRRRGRSGWRGFRPREAAHPAHFPCPLALLLGGRARGVVGTGSRTRGAGGHAGVGRAAGWPRPDLRGGIPRWPGRPCWSAAAGARLPTPADDAVATMETVTFDRLAGARPARGGRPRARGSAVESERG